MENNESKNNNKGLIILIIIFGLIVLGLGGWMVYDKVINKDEPKPVEEKDVVGYKGLKEIDVSNYQNSNNCKSEWAARVDDTPIVSKNIKTESTSINCISYEDNYLLYEDNNKLKIYDDINKKYYNVNFNCIDDMVCYLESHDDKLVGIVYLENEDSEKKSFYSIISDKTIYKNKYNEMGALSDKYVSAINYYDENDNSNAYILSASDEKIILSASSGNYNQGCGIIEYSVFNDNSNYIILSFEKTCDGGDKFIYKVYDKSLKLISEDFDGIAINEARNLVLEKNNIISVYDASGKIINTIDNYNNIINIDNKYIYYLDNNEVKYATYEKNVGTLFKLDENESNVTNIYSEDDRIEMYVVNKKVTAKEVANACKVSDDMQCEDIEMVKDCTLGYRYIYSFNTKKVTKYPAIVEYCGW